jgi:hypothetical protein
MTFDVRNPTRKWCAKEGEIYLARYPMVIFASGTTLSGVFAGTVSGVCFTGACKNITITPPETSWDKQDLLGKDSSGFQNALMDEKPPGFANLTATLLLGGDETIEDYVVSGTVTSPAGYSRYQLGGNQSSVTRLIACVAMTSSQQEDYVAFGMEDARMIKWGDIKISGPDGHWEQDIAIMCLAKNFYSEFKN